MGTLLASAGTADVVDAHLVFTASERSATVLTSDPGDIRHLANQLPTPVWVQRV